MLLLHRPPRLLLLCRHQRFSLHFPVAAFARPGRRPTALRAEAEPQSPPPASAAASPDTADDGGEEGPVELRAPTLFSVDDNPTSLQVATSVLLTGAISVFLFRSLRRRARRAKELRVRSGGLGKPKNLSEEALEALRMVSTSPVETEKPPSPVQALLGGIAAGVIALFLYKFATTIEASLNRQTISDNFSLTFNSIMDDDDSSSSPVEKISEQSNTSASSSSSTGSTSDTESDKSDLQQISDKSKNSTE